MIALIVNRSCREVLFFKAKKQEMSIVQKRKIAFIEYKNQKTNQHVLLVSCGLLTVGLFFSIFAQVHHANQSKIMNQQLEEVIEGLRTELIALTRTSLYSYPEGGGVIEAIDWQNLLTTNDRESHFTAEQDLEKQLAPFLGRSTVIIHVDPPMQEILITIMNSLISELDLSTWQDNLEQILEEFKEITVISQLSFSVQHGETAEASVEQNYIRDETGEWVLLGDVSSQEIAETDPEEQETITENDSEQTLEQKGSVEGNE
ncbi:hypothetical protein D922_01575 [Enterococcus faecalis 06-MB-DW-09]|nr:hypothetical protein D922_01575 [Enterococcus faecalis 06-MB-DW-09]